MGGGPLGAPRTAGPEHLGSAFPRAIEAVMTRPQLEQEVWFLTGSQQLYGEETLTQVARNSREIAEALDRSGAFPARVVWKPILTGPEAIEQVCLAASVAPECVGVITWMHTFSPAKMWIRGLVRLQ